MNQTQVCVDLGTKATFFGLGMLASKKMRPYAKYFIVGGLALSAAPVVMQLVERNRLKRFELEEQVDEVAFEDVTECAEGQECTAECAEADVADCVGACASECNCNHEEENCDCACGDEDGTCDCAAEAEQDEAEIPQV